MSLSRLEGLAVAEAQTLYERPANPLIATAQKEHLAPLDRGFERREKAVLKSARARPRYGRLTTVPGVGRISGLTREVSLSEKRCG